MSLKISVKLLTACTHSHRLLAAKFTFKISLGINRGFVATLIINMYFFV